MANLAAELNVEVIEKLNIRTAGGWLERLVRSFEWRYAVCCRFMIFLLRASPRRPRNRPTAQRPNNCAEKNLQRHAGPRILHVIHEERHDEEHGHAKADDAKA